MEAGVREPGTESREMRVRAEVLRLLAEYGRPLSFAFLAFSLGVTSPEMDHFIRFLAQRKEVLVNEDGYVEKVGLA